MNEKIKAERTLLSPPGDDILETIKYNRMSQAQLAKRLGKKPSKVHDIITGKEPITVNTALQLEKVLGKKREQLIGADIAAIFGQEPFELIKPLLDKVLEGARNKIWRIVDQSCILASQFVRNLTRMHYSTVRLVSVA